MMADAKFSRPCPHAGRRWIATRQLADPTRIGCATARRPASARRAATTTIDFASTI
jgi:hypothetical protein